MFRSQRINLLLWSFALLVFCLSGSGSARAQSPTPGDEPHVTGIFLPFVGVGPMLFDPLPQVDATEQSPNMWLQWNYDRQRLAQPTFSIYLEANDATPDTLIADNLDRTSFDPATYALGTDYYWQVVAHDSGQNYAGPIWHFRTEPQRDTPNIGAMVTVPAGEFQMGCDENNLAGFYCLPRDVPLHRVWLPTYAIDKYEVTNVEYRACVAAGKCRHPLESGSRQRDDYYTNTAYNYFPVLFVSQSDAMSYCAYAGKRLPTEAEWEKAARGPIDTRVFPWGNEFPDCSRDNTTDDWTNVNGVMCYGDTIQVGSLPAGATPYGAMDMAGNVFEWVVDRFDEQFYWHSPYASPVNTTSGQYITIRGGSYRARLIYTRTFFRHFGHHGGSGDGVGADAPYYRNWQQGFRCAR